MPKLPDVSAFGERPTPRPSTGVQSYRVASGSEMLPHQATQKLGDALVTVGEQIERIELSNDKLRAEDSFNQLQAKRLDLTQGDDGFTKKKSADAVKQPLMDDYTKRFDQSVEEIANGLATDRQKEFFRRRANIAGLQLKQDILTHVTREQEVYANQVFNAGIDIEIQNAVSRFNDPIGIETSSARIEGLVNDEGTRAGWPEEKKAAVKREAMSKVYASVFQRQFIESRDSINGLSALEKSVAENKDLNEEQRNVLLGRIASRSDMLAARYERLADQQDRKAKAAIDQVNSTTLLGYEPNQEQLMSVVAQAKGTSYEGEAKRMVALANETSKFRRMTPDAQEAYLTNLEAQVRKDPSKFDVTIVSKLQSIHDNQKKEVREDPISFGAKQGFYQVGPLKIEDPKAFSEEITNRFTIAEGLRKQYGSPTKVLTTEEVASVSKMLRDAPLEQRRNLLMTMANNTPDRRAYKAMMQQLAPDDPVTAVSGLLAEHGVKTKSQQAIKASDLMLRGQAILRQDKDTPGKMLPMPPEKEMIDRFGKFERDAFSGREQVRNAYFQSARAIYAAMSVEEGDYKGELDTGRWDKAMKAAVGNVEKYKGRSVVLPYGYEFSQFKDEIKTRTKALAQSGAVDTAVADKLSDLPLEPVGDGRYAFRSGDSLIVDKNGARIIVDFNSPLPQLKPEPGSEVPVRFRTGSYR